MHTSKYIGVLPLDEALSLDLDELRLKQAEGWLMPIAGGDGEGDDDSGGESHGSGDADADADDDDDLFEPDGDDDDDDSGERIEVSVAEHNRLKRIAAEAEKARKKAEREATSRREREAREQGRWQELVEERDEKVREVEAERDEARYELDSFKRRIRVQSAASRFGAKDPSDVFRYLSDDDTEDEPSTERAVRKLAREKPYLFDGKKSTGAPVNGSTGLTVEQIKNMSQDEINARWDEVQKTLASGG